MKSLPYLLVLFISLISFSADATAIKEVTGQGGIKAWLVEDHTLPLISMSFAFRGGVEQDPLSKQGLSTLTMNLLTEGAGPYNAVAFQQQLADHSIALRFMAERDSLNGSIKCLSSDKDVAFDLLHLALTAPAFDKGDLERARNQQLAALRTQLGNPDWQARYALFQQIFGTHPYGERHYGSTATLASITRLDIKDFAAAHLARSNIVISVAGDITPKQLSLLLDRVFGSLPQKAKLRDVPEVVWPQNSAIILVPREGTQTELIFAMPGPKRDDPDWYAAEIANYIVGGGGFSSRLMQDVRDKKGLTYGINTGLSPMEHGGLFVGEMAADNEKAGQAWDIALDTMRRFYQDGVTEKEIISAKDYLTGSLPLAMTSTDKIAEVLLDLQLEKMDSSYLDRRNNLLRQVTSDDIDRVIHRWFNPDGLTLALVGKPEEITPTLTKDLTRN